MSDRQRKRTLRLLHASDIHLGFGPDAGEPSLRLVSEAAKSGGVDIVLIAGDLFEHNRVSPEIVEIAAITLAGMGVPAVILPGNHDCFDENSVYRRTCLESWAPNVTVIKNPEGELLRFPELSLVIWGRPVIVHEPTFRPLRGLPAREKGWWHVAMAHGDVRGEVDRYTFPSSSPIAPEEIGSLDWDYLALGHWHTPAEATNGTCTAWYSGSPRKCGEYGIGGLLVSLDAERGICVSKAKVGRGELR